MITEVSLKEQAYHLVVGKIIALFVQVLTPIFLVRFLSKADYGLYQQILTINVLLVPILNMSLKNSLFYFYPRLGKEEINKYISAAFFLPLILTVLLCSMVVFFWNYFNSILSISFHNVEIIYIILFTAFFATSRFYEVIFVSEKKSKRALVFFIVDSFLKSISVIATAYYFKTVIHVLIAMVGYTLIESIFLYFYLKKQYRLSLFNLSLPALKRQFNYAFPLYLSTVIGRLGANSDKILLIALLSQKEFALYAVGAFKLPFLVLVYTSVGNVILPEISRYNNQNMHENAFELWKKMVLKNAIFTIPVVLFFLVVAKEFITILFTEDYIQSTPVFQILICVLFIQMLGHGYIVRGYAKTKNILYANIYKTIFSLVIGYFAIKNYGIIGAAFVYLIAFSINAGFQLIRSFSIVNVPFKNFLPWKDFLRIILITIIPLSLIIVIKLIHLKDIIYLLIASVVFFSIISYGFYKYNYISIEEIRKVLKISKNER